MNLFGSIVYSGDAIDLILIDENDRVVFRRVLLNEIDIVHEQLKPFSRMIKALVILPVPQSRSLVKGLIRRRYRVHLPNMKMAERYLGVNFQNSYVDPVALARMLRVSCTNKRSGASNNRRSLDTKANKSGRISFIQRLKCFVFNV